MKERTKCNGCKHLFVHPEVNGRAMCSHPEANEAANYHPSKTAEGPRGFPRVRLKTVRSTNCVFAPPRWCPINQPMKGTT